MCVCVCVCVCVQSQHVEQTMKEPTEQLLRELEQVEVRGRDGAGVRGEISRRGKEVGRDEGLREGAKKEGEEVRQRGGG